MELSLRNQVSHLSVWLPLVVLVFSLYANSSNPPLSPTPFSVSANILMGFVFVISGIGLAACWDAYQMRKVFAELLVGRCRAKLLGWLFTPVIAWTIISFVGLWLQACIQLGEIVPPSGVGFYLALIMCVAWASFGIALAWSLHPALALVLSGVMPFTVTSFAWAVNDSAWRHMFGVPITCCSLGGVISNRMVLASSLGLLTIVLLALVVFLVGRRRAAQAIGLFLAAVLVGGVSYSTATSIDSYAGMQARDASEQICESDICYWPESSTSSIEKNRAALQKLYRTMPHEWLPPTSAPVLVADRRVYIGIITEKHAEFGDLRDPLYFEDIEDTDAIFERFVSVLLARAGIGGVDRATPGSEFWQQWAAAQEPRGNATVEEVRNAVALEVARMNRQDSLGTGAEHN